MKKIYFKYIVYYFLLGVLPLFSGCEKNEAVEDNNTDSDKVSIIFDKPVLSLPYNNDLDVKVLYSFHNLSQDYSLELTTKAEWIKDLKENNGEIHFSVIANNENVSRQDTVFVVCNFKDETKLDSYFVVKQSVRGNDAFKINIGDNGSSWVKFSIKPEDNQMKYVINYVSERDYLKLLNDEDLFAKDIVMMKQMAEEKSVSLKLIIDGLSKSGAMDDAVVRLEAGEKYYLYCYGLSSKGELLTPVTKQSFMTKSWGPVDNQISFEFQPGRNLVKYSVKTTTFDSYTFGLFPKGDFTEEEIKTKLKSGELGLYAGDIIDQQITGLSQNVTYEFIAVGLVGGKETSALFRQEFTTQKGEDLTLSIFTEGFDGDEVTKLIPDNPNYNFTGKRLIVHSVPSTNASYVYSNYFEKEWADGVRKQMETMYGETLTDEQFYRLLIDANIDYCSPYEVSLWPIAVEDEGVYYVITLALDDLKDMWIAKANILNLTQGNFTDAKEFLKYLPSSLSRTSSYPYFKNINPNKYGAVDEMASKMMKYLENKSNY